MMVDRQQYSTIKFNVISNWTIIFQSCKRMLNNTRKSSINNKWLI